MTNRAAPNPNEPPTTLTNHTAVRVLHIWHFGSGLTPSSSIWRPISNPSASVRALCLPCGTAARTPSTSPTVPSSCPVVPTSPSTMPTGRNSGCTVAAASGPHRPHARPSATPQLLDRDLVQCQRPIRPRGHAETLPGPATRLASPEHHASRPLVLLVPEPRQLAA